MFCILREDLNEIIENKVFDESYLEMEKDDLSEKGLYSSFVSTLVVNSILDGNVFQFGDSRYGIEFLEELKKGEVGSKQLCLLSSCVREGIKKTMELNLISEKENNLCESLLDDYEKNGFYLPFMGQID